MGFTVPLKQFAKYDFGAKMGPDAKDPKCAPRFKQWTSDPFWVCCSVDSSLAYNRTFGQMGDAYRSLFKSWQYDVSNIKCPVYNFQGEHDCAARTWALRHPTHR